MNHARKYALGVFLSLAAMGIGGCVSGRLYTGPALPPSQTARLEIRQIGTWLLWFDNLLGPVTNDAGQAGWPAPGAFEIPGGTHTLSVQYIGIEWLEPCTLRELWTGQERCLTFTSPPVTLAFEAQPGHRYLLTAAPNQNGATPLPLGMDAIVIPQKTRHSLAAVSCCPMVVDLSVGGKAASAGPLPMTYEKGEAVPGGPPPRHGPAFRPPPPRFR